MKIPEELLPVIEWWERDGKKTLAIAGVAGLAALAWWSWMSHKEAVREAAAAALIADSSVEELQSAVAQYGEGECAAMLKMKLASALLDRGNDGDAQAALGLYEAVAAGEVPPAYAEIPPLGKASCLESLEKFEEACKEYRSCIDTNDDGLLKLDAVLGLARCTAQTGNREEALKILEEAKKDASASDIARIDGTADIVKRWKKRAPVEFNFDEPETPPAPETPATAQVPTAPEASASAETPAAPETPASPEAPAAPEASASAETPAAPETPASPEAPAATETPQN